MTPDQIRAAILADQQLRAYVESGNDQAVADALTLQAEPVPTHELYTERAMFAELGPLVAESIMAKLEAFATSGNSGASVVARGLRWLQPANGGLDFQNADLKTLLAGLHVAGILTADELAALGRLGTRPGAVTHAQVGEAVAPWRPDGKIQPIPSEV
jgi:hypothetical protein